MASRSEAEAEVELAEDMKELSHLLSQAKRARVQSLLSSEIQRVAKAQEAVLSQNQVKVEPSQTTIPTPVVRYVTLSTFSWDQDSEKAKIYVSIEGASADKVSSEFHSSSFDVKLHDVAGKHYRFGIQRLHKAIIPDKCVVSVKPKRIIITLKKKDNSHWTDLHYKEDKMKPKLDSKDDPMGGLMDLMKNMYEEGDEEMKKTIAKAWTETQSGKKSDPLKRFDNL